MEEKNRIKKWNSYMIGGCGERNRHKQKNKEEYKKKQEGEKINEEFK